MSIDQLLPILFWLVLPVGLALAAGRWGYDSRDGFGQAQESGF